MEKFIGDAVMAVWGTPVAREDDAERAVRAALSLTQAVALLGEEVGMPELRVRAGVLTGNAAVEVGAEGEGMVLGDTVNTASRLQSIAAPGTVLVDDVTRRASEAAIAYEDAGEHQVKGREQPVRAWTALRVVAGAGGARRSAGLEAPFVGRERELAQRDRGLRGERRAAPGAAGHGRRRGGLGQVAAAVGVLQVHRRRRAVVRWHQGRCLSYGDGVAYWALAEMVRARAGITEEERPDSARAKLRDGDRAATCPTSASGGWSSRGWPTCSASSSAPPPTAPTCSAAGGCSSSGCPSRPRWCWCSRICSGPTAACWSSSTTCSSGRPSARCSCSRWGALSCSTRGRRGARARSRWGRCPTRRCASCSRAWCPGLPEELAARVLARAEGVPLYAVETVRMLLDRGLLTQEGSRYRVTGDVGELDVPETLHALAAARLDGLTAGERAVLQDASVFGQSFTPAGVAALSERSTESVIRILDGLVAKQVLGFNDDRLSAERGQYHFLQALLRTTAYGTLARKDRKNRHLAAARHLQEAWGERAPELAEVLAAHFLDAAAADPDAADAPRIRAAACETLAEAGQRALSLALGAEAQRAFDRAAELAEDDLIRARLLDQAGRAALLNAEYDLGARAAAAGGRAVRAARRSASAAREPGRDRRGRSIPRTGSTRRSSWNADAVAAASRGQRRAGGRPGRALASPDLPERRSRRRCASPTQRWPSREPLQRVGDGGPRLQHDRQRPSSAPAGSRRRRRCASGR